MAHKSYLTSSLFLWKCLSANCGCKWCWLTTTLAPPLLSGYKSPGEFNQIINLPQGVEQLLTWSKKSHIEDFNNEVLPWNCHCTYQRPHRNCLFSVWLPLNQFQSLAFPSTAKCKALKCYSPDSKCFFFVSSKPLLQTKYMELMPPFLHTESNHKHLCGQQECGR